MARNDVFAFSRPMRTREMGEGRLTNVLHVVFPSLYHHHHRQHLRSFLNMRRSHGIANVSHRGFAFIVAHRAGM